MKHQMLSLVYRLLLCSGCIGLCHEVAAQKPAFYNEVQAFKAQDKSLMPPKHAILFIGSSSFTKWVNVQDYFPRHIIVNRAFGGSSLPDVIRYANTVIFPYQPKQIVIYCGENDLAGKDSITTTILFSRFKKLFQLIRRRMPVVPVAYVSMKPSIKRIKLIPKIIQGNALIKNFLATRPATVFINVFDKMLDQDGLVMPDIFLADSLHMNAKGYAIWQKVMEPYLLPATPPLKGGHGDGPTGVKDLLKTKQ